MIGPHRGGRTVAAVGIPEEPNVFYIGVNNGGVWKTTDAGRVWRPIFDAQPTGSIGALALAPSNPEVIYVGSGEVLQRPDLSTGDGLYRSRDGGKTWTHLGLRDGQQLPALAVDPRDPDRLFVAVLGHPYGPNSERGLFRSTDGGQSFERVLYRNEDTGAVDVAIDPQDPRTVYAVLWSARQPPWEGAGGSLVLSQNNGLYKSQDGGTTWRQLTDGLPGAAEGLGRIGLEICRQNPQRLYAILGANVGGGLYRSDDAGEHWARINDDERLWGRDGDFNEVRADPKNPDILYVANVSTWRSTDGGKHFSAFRGAPGGDDYHRLWINPEDPRIILLTADQGAAVTVNGGETWSSWYNQPTAQLFHVNTDNAFPYRVCGGQQESGSVCIASRGEDGHLTFRDWLPAGAEEYGYAVPDPRDPEVVYGGKITRFDRRTREVRDVRPRLTRGEDFRVVRTQPIAFSPADPRVLFFASNVVWKTTDGGTHWEKISPDLSRPSAQVPPNLGAFARLTPNPTERRGVVYALSPSPKEVKRLWAGTDDGLIHLTVDGGKHWLDVTPPELKNRPWAKVSILEASHFATSTAYAAVNTLRLDDLRPYLYRTRDGGQTWTRITTGIPDGETVNVLREDPEMPGLLFAGSEREVYVSFDDGDHWQSLRLNLPVTSIRDLVIKDADVVIATHGRSFWILDNIEPLRQLSGKNAPFLIRPPLAYRVRWSKNTDTPLPPDEPTGQNPPEGVAIDYVLGENDTGPVTLEVLDEGGATVRRFSSEDPPAPLQDEENIPAYWIRPERAPTGGPGHHRFIWDLHGAPPKTQRTDFQMSAIPGETPREPRGPWAVPGRYTIRLVTQGKTRTQPLILRMDPRVRVTPAALARQLSVSQALLAAGERTAEALEQVKALQGWVRDAASRSPDSVTDGLEELAKTLDGLAGTPSVRGAPRRDATSLARLNEELQRLYQQVQSTDDAPSPLVETGWAEDQKVLDGLLKRWAEVKTRKLPTLEARLREAGVSPLSKP